MDTVRRLFYMVVASLVIWSMVAMVEAVTGSSGVTDAAAIIAFLCTMSIWLVWGLAQIEHLQKAAAQDNKKAKRSAAGTDDARIALLMQLLDDEQRRTLQQRLLDDLGADGEALPLADLLADQDAEARQTGA